MFFTFDAVAKAELELHFADEKLAELDKLAREEAQTKESLEQALQNYLNSHLKLQNRLESLKGKNKNVDELLDKLADRVVEHEELFEELEEKFDENAQKQIEKSIAKITKRALELDEEKFKNKFKEKLRMAGKDVEDEELEELEEIEDFEDFFEGLDDPEEGLMENNEEIDENGKQEKNKEDTLKKCGPMPLRPVPIGCSGPVCEDGKWEFSCPETDASPPVPTPKRSPPPSPTPSLPQPTPLPSPSTTSPQPSPVPAPEQIKINIINFGFSPQEIRIPQGSRVTWTNKDSTSHTVTSDNNLFSSSLLGNESQFSRIFNEKGSFSYHCSPHPSMTGKIIVE